MAEYKLTPI